MRYALLAIFVAALWYAGCGATNPTCTGTGSSNTTKCSGNGQGGAGQQPSPLPSSAPSPIAHVPDVSYVGFLIAGQSGTVNHSLICSSLSIAMGGNVGNGPGRQLSVIDCPNTQGMNYFDFMRPNINGNAPGAAMVADSNYSECSQAWFLHKPTCTVGNRTNPVGTAGNLNFLNTTFTAPWWKRCFDGTATGSIAPTTCNGTSPLGPGDTTGHTFDGGQIIFADTSSTTIAAVTQGATPTVEIGNDPAFINAVKAWTPLAAQHANGQAYGINWNGLTRATSTDPLSGQGACPFVIDHGSPYSCLDLMGLPNTVGGTLEFAFQNPGPPPFFSGNLFPWHINSATDVIAAGGTVYELSEPDPVNFPGTGNQQASPNGLLAYYAGFLLTFNPKKPTAEYDWLDVDDHASGNSSNNLAVFPVQFLVPYGNIAIPITAYAPGAGPTFGIDGCANGTDPSGETDSGGIIPYLIVGSCGTHGALNIGAYANASNLCSNNLTPIGPCIYGVNLSNQNYTVTCASILALAAKLGVAWVATGAGGDTFTHWVGIGQIPNPNDTNVVSGAQGDITAFGGGSMTISDTTNATFKCGSATDGVVAPLSGFILVP